MKKNHIVSQNVTLLEALSTINILSPEPLVLFAIDENGKMIGALTDGDSRRALISGASVNDPISKIVNRDFLYLTDEINNDVRHLHDLKLKKMRLVPILDKERHIVEIIDLERFHTKLPIDAVIDYQGQTLHDFETAYGYGGPIWHHVNEKFKAVALQLMVEELKRQNYIAGFVRFHPLLANYEGFSEGRIIEDRKTVAIDLSLEEDDIWMQEIHTKNRNVIKKGEKSGLTFVVDNDYKYLPEFIRLYDATMDKLDAADFYYFKQQYYEEFVKTLPNSFLGVVLYEDRVISAAIFMYEGCYGHYHLSGSDVSALRLSPNNYMLWHAALELKR